MISHGMTSSTFEIPGRRISGGLGIVKGIVVRSRSVFGTIGASLQTMVGGDNGGNVQGIQRYGRTLRTDPDQGEGYSYHVYPVANPTQSNVVVNEPTAAPQPADFDFGGHHVSSLRRDSALAKRRHSASWL